MIKPTKHGRRKAHTERWLSMLHLLLAKKKANFPQHARHPYQIVKDL